MSGGNTVAPVIIKRKKVVADGGHHGGAWKVAYADFVTAMMAFFMLMWLLNATTETQRKGIADYFSPTIAIARVSGGGNGALGGDSVMSEQSLSHVGTGATSENPTESDRARGYFDQGAQSRDPAEDRMFREIEERLLGRGGESALADDQLQHIVTEVTDEGLVIELHETVISRLFTEDNRPTEMLRGLLSEIAMAAGPVLNNIAIEAHTASAPVVMAHDPAWDISQARADMAHRQLTSMGVPKQRIERITAHADREPAFPNPMAKRNNRLEIIFLRED